jgi:hypothetical protein
MEGLTSRLRWDLLMVRLVIITLGPADVIVFLASADSNAMTGQCMHLVSLTPFSARSSFVAD